MPPFNGEKKTPNRTFDPSKDNVCPTLRSMNMTNMKDTKALQGQTGSDCKLVHGDRWQQIDGSQTEKINEDLTSDIMKNEVWTVHENYTTTVDGKTVDTRNEDVKEFYHADSHFEYFLEHTDQHREKDHQRNPTHTFDMLNIEGEYKNVDLAIKATAFEAKGLSIDAIVLKGEAWGAGAEAFGAQVGAGGYENAVCGYSAQEKALDHRLEGMENEIKGIHTHMGGPKILIIPTRIGICIAIHIDSPFA